MTKRVHRRVRFAIAAAIATAVALAGADLLGSAGSNAALASAQSARTLYKALRTGPVADAGTSLKTPQETAQAERWPMAGTVRELTLDVPGVTAYIAESYAGGVCVIASVAGLKELGLSCSGPGDIQRGAAVEFRDIPSLPGKTVSVGVVPDGNTTESVPSTNGTGATVPVAGNAWAHIATESGA